MPLYREYLQARQVENEIERILGEREISVCVYSAPWKNGRENGFCFSHYDISATFTYVYVAENRNSDQLTVTVSNYSDWASVLEREYCARKYFDPYAYREVAEFVLKTLGIITS